MEEINSFFELYSKLDDVINKAIMSDEPQKSTFLLKDVYVMTKQSLYNITERNGMTLLGKFDEKGKFELFKTYYNFELFKDIEPIYEMFKGRGKEYAESPSDKIHEVKKYEVEISITVKIAEDGKQEIASGIEKITEEPEVYEPPSTETISILKKMPYLVGLLGIKGINIPVIVDSEIVLQGLERDCGLNLEPIADTLQETLSRKLGIITMGDKEMQPIFIPEMIGKDKVYFAYNNLPKNIINILNSNRLIIDDYSFKNDSKIVLMLISNIDEYLNSRFVSQKKGTYINDFLISHEKDTLKKLITSNSISAQDFTKYTGYSITDIDKMLTIYSLIMKTGIQAVNYKVMRILFDIFPEIFSDDTKNIIYVVSIVYSAFLLYGGFKTTEDFHELEKQIKEFVDNNINKSPEGKTIYKNELREELKSVFEITDYLATTIIEQLDKTGYINIHEDGKTVTFEKQLRALFK